MGIFNKKNEKKDYARTPKIRNIDDNSLLPQGYLSALIREVLENSHFGELVRKADQALGFEQEKYGHYLYYYNPESKTIVTLPWTKERKNDAFSMWAKDKLRYDAYLTYCQKSKLDDHLKVLRKARKITHTNTWVEFFTELDKQYAKDHKQYFNTNGLPSNISFLSDMEWFIYYRKKEIAGYVDYLKKQKKNLDNEYAKAEKDQTYEINKEYIDSTLDNLKWTQNSLDYAYKQLKTTEQKLEDTKPLQAKMNLIHKNSKKGASKEISDARGAHERTLQYEIQQRDLAMEKIKAEQELRNIDYKQAKLEKEYIENENKQNKIDNQFENQK